MTTQESLTDLLNRAEAILFTFPGIQRTEIAKEMELHPSQLSRWITARSVNPGLRNYLAIERWVEAREKEIARKADIHAKYKANLAGIKRLRGK